MKHGSSEEGIGRQSMNCRTGCLIRSIRGWLCAVVPIRLELNDNKLRCEIEDARESCEKNNFRPILPSPHAAQHMPSPAKTSTHQQLELSEATLDVSKHKEGDRSERKYRSPYER